MEVSLAEVSLAEGGGQAERMPSDTIRGEVGRRWEVPLEVLIQSTLCVRIYTVDLAGERVEADAFSLGH